MSLHRFCFLSQKTLVLARLACPPMRRGPHAYCKIRDYYRVRATNAVGNSAFSNEASAITGAILVAKLIDSGGVVVIGSTKNKGVVNPDQGDTAKIFFKGIQTGKYECRIFTLTGELVWQDTVDNVSSGIFEWIPKDIASGGYIASVIGPGVNEKKKIAVLR